MIEVSVVAVPDRAGFPGATTIHHHHGGFVHSGIRVGADGVGQMVIHKALLRARLAEVMLEAVESAVLMRHAGEQQRGIQDAHIRGRKLAADKAFQVGGKQAVRRRPSLANKIEPIGTHLGELHAGANGVVGEAGIVFQPADAFLRYRIKQFAVAHNARGGIVHL
jgi:hypothetical protein